MTAIQEQAEAPATVGVTVTELDVYRADSDQLTSTYPDYVGDGAIYAWTERQDEAEIFADMLACCGGTDKACGGHYGFYYLALDDYT